MIIAHSLIKKIFYITLIMLSGSVFQPHSVLAVKIPNEISKSLKELSTINNNEEVHVYSNIVKKLQEVYVSGVSYQYFIESYNENIIDINEKTKDLNKEYKEIYKEMNKAIRNNDPQELKSIIEATLKSFYNEKNISTFPYNNIQNYESYHKWFYFLKSKNNNFKKNSESIPEAIIEHIEEFDNEILSNTPLDDKVSLLTNNLQKKFEYITDNFINNLDIFSEIIKTLTKDTLKSTTLLKEFDKLNQKIEAAEKKLGENYNWSKHLEKLEADKENIDIKDKAAVSGILDQIKRTKDKIKEQEILNNLYETKKEQKNILHEAEQLLSVTKKELSKARYSQEQLLANLQDVLDSFSDHCEDITEAGTMAVVKKLEAKNTAKDPVLIAEIKKIYESNQHKQEQKDIEEQKKDEEFLASVKLQQTSGELKQNSITDSSNSNGSYKIKINSNSDSMNLDNVSVGFKDIVVRNSVTLNPNNLDIAKFHKKDINKRNSVFNIDINEIKKTINNQMENSNAMQTVIGKNKNKNKKKDSQDSNNEPQIEEQDDFYTLEEKDRITLQKNQNTLINELVGQGTHNAENLKKLINEDWQANLLDTYKILRDFDEKRDQYSEESNMAAKIILEKMTKIITFYKSHLPEIFESELLQSQSSKISEYQAELTKQQENLGRVSHTHFQNTESITQIQNNIQDIQHKINNIKLQYLAYVFENKSQQEVIRYIESDIKRNKLLSCVPHLRNIMDKKNIEIQINDKKQPIKTPYQALLYLFNQNLIKIKKESKNSSKINKELLAGITYKNNNFNVLYRLHSTIYAFDKELTQLKKFQDNELDFLIKKTSNPNQEKETPITINDDIIQENIPNKDDLIKDEPFYFELVRFNQKIYEEKIKMYLDSDVIKEN